MEQGLGFEHFCQHCKIRKIPGRDAQRVCKFIVLKTLERMEEGSGFDSSLREAERGMDLGLEAFELIKQCLENRIKEPNCLSSAEWV